MSCSCEESSNVLPNNVPPLHTGFLRYHKAKWFATSEWNRVFGILYQDSTLIWWYETQMASRPEGIICLKLAPELIATGQYSRRLFQVPSLPSNISGTGIENMIAVGERHRRQRVHFFLAETQQDFNAWWTAMASTLPVAAAAPLATMAPAPTQPTQPIIHVPSALNYQPTVPAVRYVVQDQQQHPIPSTTNTIVIRDSGPSYGGEAAVGLAAGAVMGAALTNIAHTGSGWGGYGGYYGGYYPQDNDVTMDVTIVNNYNLDYNIEQGDGNVSTNYTEPDWSSSTYDDYYDGGVDF